MSKQTSKQEYDHHGRIEEMWRLGQDLGLSSSHIHTVFTAVLAQEEEMETNHQLKEGRGADNRMGATNTRTVVGFNVMTTTQTMLLKAVVVGVKALVCFTLVCFLSCALISLHNPTRKLVTRNIQDLIYPVMTTLRIFTLPVLRRYPHLSQWYSEECLVPNVYFNSRNVGCSSCSEKFELLIKFSSLNNFTSSYYNSGRFCIVTDAVHKKVSLMNLLGKINIREEIKLGAWKHFPKSSSIYGYVEQLKSGQSLRGNEHVEWKIATLESLHKLRQIFPRPYFIPRETEVALHRFLLIDGPGSDSYSLPLPEFANVIVVQGIGQSVFYMLPSSPCRNYCNPVTITLESSQVLFYNWIYWRPMRLKSSHFSTLVLSSFY